MMVLLDLFLEGLSVENLMKIRKYKNQLLIYLMLKA